MSLPELEELLEVSEAKSQYAVLPRDKTDATEFAAVDATTLQPLAELPPLHTIGPQIFSSSGVIALNNAWFHCSSC